MTKYLDVPDHLQSLIEKRDAGGERRKRDRRSEASAKGASVSKERRTGKDRRQSARRKRRGK